MYLLIWDINTIQYNTIQYNTIQYNTIPYNTIQYIAIMVSGFVWLNDSKALYHLVQGELQGELGLAFATIVFYYWQFSHRHHGFRLFLIDIQGSSPFGCLGAMYTLSWPLSSLCITNAYSLGSKPCTFKYESISPFFSADSFPSSNIMLSCCCINL